MRVVLFPTLLAFFISLGSLGEGLPEDTECDVSVPSVGCSFRGFVSLVSVAGVIKVRVG